MSNHPVNLALRFVLELAALFSLGYWGWTQQSGSARWLSAIGLPLLAAALWGIFRVPGDPRDAPVPIPGFLRLVFELILFGAAVWALYAAHRQTWRLILGILVLGHYIASYDRVIWLIRR